MKPVNLQKSVDHHLSYEQGFSQDKIREVEELVDQGQQNLQADRLEMQEQLAARSQQIPASLEPRLQELKDHDSGQPARTHVKNLKISIKNLERKNRSLVKVVDKAEAHFNNVKKQNTVLKNRLFQLQKSKENPNQEDRLPSFLNQASQRICKKISKWEESK